MRAARALLRNDSNRLQVNTCVNSQDKKGRSNPVEGGRKENHRYVHAWIETNGEISRSTGRIDCEKRGCGELLAVQQEECAAAEDEKRAR